MQNPNKHSLEAVAELMKSIDLNIKRHIFEITHEAMNNTDNYVYKSSKLMAKVAIQVVINRPDHALQDEEYFFDGAHKICKGYKTLVL